MSIVLPPPPSPKMMGHTTPPSLPRSRPHTPTSRSRPGTPPVLPLPHHALQHANALSGLQPISAPSTPVTSTHFFPSEPGPSRMERCRSSEAAIGLQQTIPGFGASTGMGFGDRDKERERESRDGSSPGPGRKREVKTTSLLFKTSPSREQLHRAESDNARSFHLEAPVSLAQESTPQGQLDAAQERQDRADAGVPEVDDKMDIDEDVTSSLLTEEAVAEKMTHMTETAPQVWGMPKWGWEDERKEVRKGVRLVGMEELPALIEQHNMLDVPSHVLFPWLHGIADDGPKGRDMAAFFGHAPPFEPPPYRGLSLLLAPPHPLDSRPIFPRPTAMQSDSDKTVPKLAFTASPPQTPSNQITHERRDTQESRDRSETMSTSSESYVSSNETDATSPSIADFQLKTPTSPARSSQIMEPEVVVSEDDVQMHPCESKRVSIQLPPKSNLMQEQIFANVTIPGFAEDSSDSSSGSGDNGPSCIFANALHAQDIFDFPAFSTVPYEGGQANFRLPRLPHNINLRNLNIQQIKYTTVSDVILYAKNGVGAGVLQIAEMIAESQERLYNERMKDFYVHHQDRGEGEGLGEPVRYGVWVLVEPFHKVEKYAQHLVNVDARGLPTEYSTLTDLFEREAIESRAMTAASEVVEGFWVGNDCDAPLAVFGSRRPTEKHVVPRVYDLCVRASEALEMPTSAMLTHVYKRLVDMDKRRKAEEIEHHSWVASPATIALRNLLTPGGSTGAPPDTGSKRASSPSDESTPTKTRKARGADNYEAIYMDCAGSCRTITGQLRNLTQMTDKVVELVYFLRKLVEGRDKTGIKRRILVYCQDGYTESSIIVLAYIMSSLSVSLPEAYLHLQTNAKRSFFLYPADKPLLRRVDARLAADRKAQAIKLVSSPPPSPHSAMPHSPSSSSSSLALSSRWKSWGFGAKDTASQVGGSSTTSTTTTTTATAVGVVSASAGNAKQDQRNTVEVAREMLAVEEQGGTKESQDAKIWFDDRRFDGFPSRILEFLYLGNLEHAGNAGMLHALGITHVVSVGESLISCPPDSDPMYGQIGSNTLSAEYAAGRIQVLDLDNIRDDGNDPLRPLIAKACSWIEEARQNGGTVLVHCRVGVSRSASIVMAYMMQHRRMGLMDAYLLTRARRLNVLIQPNLRFFHELFGWEVELAKAEEKALAMKKEEYERNGKHDEAELQAIQRAEEAKRRIYYSWPAFCRDLHCLNRRFLCN